MATGLNKVILIGYLGKAPEYREKGETRAANFSLAVTESWKDRNAKKQERTEWFRVAMFGGLAGIANSYLEKGSRVYIEGRFRTNEWTDSDGAKKRSTEVIANNMIMLDSRKRDSGSNAGTDEDIPF